MTIKKVNTQRQLGRDKEKITPKYIAMKPTACWIYQYLCNNNSVKFNSVKKKKKTFKTNTNKEDTKSGNLYDLDDNIQVSPVWKRWERKNIHIHLYRMELISNIWKVPQLLYMAKGNSFCFKYIKVPADNISSWWPLAEGRFVIEGLKFNIEKSLRYRVGTRKIWTSANYYVTLCIKVSKERVLSQKYVAWLIHVHSLCE
jgi:hypothetical protein